jgi:hypothetical protein
MNYPKKLYIPAEVAELVFGNTSCDEVNACWHIMDFGGCGEHTFCTMAGDEITILNSQFGIEDKSKRGGFCTCPECIRRVIDLYRKLDKIKGLKNGN